MKCCVCGHETPPRQRYCDRCRVAFGTKYDRLRRREALREAYDRESDGFRCHWSGVLLDWGESESPFGPSFDHIIPVRRSRFVASSTLFNQMKNELAPDEFHRIIQELAAHRAGRPFDSNCIKFQ